MKSPGHLEVKTADGDTVVVVYAGRGRFKATSQNGSYENERMVMKIVTSLVQQRYRGERGKSLRVREATVYDHEDE